MAFEAIAHDLEHYGESWKNDHDDAMVVIDLEYEVRKGVAIYECIVRLDELVRSTEISPTRLAEPLGLIDKMFDQWISTSRRVIETIEKYQAKGYDIDRAEELVASLAEAEVISGPQESFFSSGPLSDLAEDAMKQHQEGTTESCDS